MARVLTIKVTAASKLDLELGDAASLALVRKSQGNAGTRVLMDSFQARGGRSYWGAAAKSTTARVAGDHVALEVRHPGVRLHWLGGVVKPGKGVSSKTGQPTKALAIPAIDAVKGIAPGGAGELAYVPARGGGKLVGLLVDGEQRVATRGKNKGKTYTAPAKSGRVKYTLVTETKHDPDPSVVPTQDIATAMLDTTGKVISLIIKRKNK